MAESTLDPEITPTDELERLVVHVQRAQHNGLYFVASPTPDQSTVAALIADRFANTGCDDVREVVLSADNLNLIGFLRGLRMPDGKGMVIAYGLDALSPKLRIQAYGHMNLGREFLRVAGYRVVVVASQEVLTDLSLNAPDFFAWRSITAEIALPTDPAQREQLISQLRLRAASDQRDPIQALCERYLQSVATSLGWLDFRGLSQVRNMMRVKLLDVFTPLTATQTQSNTRFAPFLGRDRRSPPTKKTDFEVMHEWAERPQPVRVSLDDAVREQTRLVILGDPGSGKSTALRRIALLCANQRNPANAGIDFAQPLLPILIPISSYAQWLQSQPANDAADTLMQFVPHYFAQLGLPNLAPLFETHIHNGSAIMLLDGMDEVPTLDVRQRIRRQIDMFCAAHPKNRVLVSSRIAGYGTAALGSDFTVLTIAPFERDDITRFTQQWSAAYEAVTADCAPNALPPEAQLRAERRAANLSEAIFANPSIERLAQTPLLLTLLALIHEQGARLPNRRIELYKLCVEALTETWNRARSLTGNAIELLLGERRLDARLVTDLLAPLAYAAQVRQPGGLMGRDWVIQKLLPPLQQHLRCTLAQASAFANEFIGLLREQIGILVERAPDQFGWLHLTFGEYLAAVFLSRKANALDMLKPRLHDPRWREVILLTAASLEGDYAERFVHGILHANSPWEDLLHFDLLLAARCMGDEVAVSEEDKLTINRQLLPLFIKDDFFLDNNFVIGSEVRSIMSTWPQTDLVYLFNAVLNALNSRDVEIRERIIFLLHDLPVSIVNYPSFLDTILKILLKVDLYSFSYWKIASSLRKFPLSLGLKQENVEKLLFISKNQSEISNERIALGVGAIGFNSVEAISTLLRLLQDEDSDVRKASLWALGQIKPSEPKIFSALVQSLGDDSTRYHSAEALKSLISNAATISTDLLDLLNSPIDDIRQSVISILSVIINDNANILNTIFFAFHDSNKDVRLQVLEALEKIATTNVKALNILFSALHDKSWTVVNTAENMLLGLQPKSIHVIQRLEVILQDKQGLASCYAAKILNKFTSEICALLVKGLMNSDVREQKKAVKVSGDQIWNKPNVIEALLAIINNKNTSEEDIRFYAIRSLSKIKSDSQNVVDLLIRLLDETNEFIRIEAAIALGRMNIDIPMASKVLLQELRKIRNYYDLLEKSVVEELINIIQHPNYQLIKMLAKDAKRTNGAISDFLYYFGFAIPSNYAYELLWHLAPKWWADRSDELAAQEN